MGQARPGRTVRFDDSVTEAAVDGAISTVPTQLVRDCHQDKSFEELRLEHYQASRTHAGRPLAEGVVAAAVVPWLAAAPAA
eukprot:8339133-Lingulodinium_polyedra.AAC.1